MNHFRGIRGNMGMRKGSLREKDKWKKAAALCMAGMLVLSLAGCGGKTGGGDDGQGGTVSDVENGNAEPIAMGRYVETMTEVDTGPIKDLTELSDGRLVFLEDGAEGRWISEDGGETWKPDMLPGWIEFVSSYFAHDMKAAPDGSVAILYQRYRNMAAGMDTEAEDGEETGEESAEAEKAMELGEEETPKGEVGTGSEAEQPKLGEEAEPEAEEQSESEEERPEEGICLLSPEGEKQWIGLPIEEEESLNCLCFSEDGSRLFAASWQQKIYEVDLQTGTAKLFMTADVAPDTFCVWEKYMVLKSEVDGVVLYDLDTKERIADDVITDFVKKNCAVSDVVATSTYSIFPAEEEGVYLVCRKGVYRHVIGGTVMEQVINGGLSSLSDPTRHVAKMIRTAKEGFITAFSEGMLSVFAYDPDMASTPSQKLSAYSLTESTILRQAIIRYQRKYPDVYVEYRVGMDEDGSVTREDAVKKLNTEIMAGKGPDFLLLDGLPAESYLEKGVLADLGPCLAELEKEEKLLPNIRESFTEDGEIYMMPAAFTLPFYMADKENMTNVSDLRALAEMFEKLRSDYPGEGIMETYSVEVLLDALMPVSAPLWITDAGQLNVEEMSIYLEQAKRIYDACMDELPDELLRKYKDRAEGHVGSSDEISAYNDLQGGALQILAGKEKVTLGELKNAYNYAFLQSIRQPGNGENGKNCKAVLLPGSVAGVFQPLCLMGINAASDQTDLAGDFLREILSKETQRMLYPTGFPVNEDGLSDYLDSLGGMVPEDRRKPGEIFGAYGFTEDDGVITLDLFMPTQQERDGLCDVLTSVHTPYLSDVVVDDAVREAGVYYLEGRVSLEEALEGIREKIAIYMAE